MGDGRLSANCPANMRELLSIVPSNSVSPNPNAEVLRVPFNLSDCAEERYGSHCKGTGLALGQESQERTVYWLSVQSKHGKACE